MVQKKSNLALIAILISLQLLLFLNRLYIMSRFIMSRAEELLADITSINQNIKESYFGMIVVCV
jgi:hypothetical protein